MSATNRTGLKVTLVALAVLGGGTILAKRHLAASLPPVAETDSRPRVDLVSPRRLTLAHRLQTNATLEAFEETDLFAKVSGYVSDVRVDIGDHVKAGQVLAVIDIPEMYKELAEAEADLESKKSSLERARRQLGHFKAKLSLETGLQQDREQLGAGRGFISSQTLDQMRANTEIAKADLEVAEAERSLAANQVDVAAANVEKIKTLLTYTQMAAPFDGVVSRRLVNRGDLVQAATSTKTAPLFTVQRIDIIRVFCDVPEDDVPYLRIGDSAIVKPIGLKGESYVGNVTRFSLRLNPETRNMRTEIDLQNPEERLYPGMYAQVSLEMNRKPEVLTLPAASIGSDGGGNFVHTVDNDRIKRVAIKSGVSDNGNVEVTEGLSDNMSVVSIIKNSPAPGTAVQTPVPPKD
jgi:RND family efflux transporter MFP subunit